jgi:hypoxanthine phosphoribosyltransferase
VSGGSDGRTLASDARPRTLASRDDLGRAVARLGAEISRDHPQGVVLVGVLTGVYCFLADLMRALSVKTKVDFLAISSYESGGGRVRLVKDLDLDISGQPVVLVEEIVDTGLTLNYVLGELRRRDPASLEACTLLDRPARRILPVGLRYVGLSIPDEYVIGYGLDFAGRYRNLPALCAGDLALLESDPDAYVGSLYGD